MLKIWCLAPDQWDHIKPVQVSLGSAAEFIYDSACNAGAMLAGFPDLVLCVNEFRLEVANCLHAARSQAIPTLLLQDGILEWRCQYENPLFGVGGGPPQHQPVLCDRIACIGEQSARVIRSWGNEGRVEVTGMPRLDHLQSRSPSALYNPGRRILVATAKNPGFTCEQRDVTTRSLFDLKAELDARPQIGVTWRLSKDLAGLLGVANRCLDFSSQDLASAVESVDAFITTSSTSMLEGMFLGRPVAVLDYHNVPRFVPSVWTISAREHIGKVIDDLLRRPENKMQYQTCLLHDALACEGLAADRVANLIRLLTGQRTRSNGMTVVTPEIRNRSVSNTRADLPVLAKLYPDEPIFRVTDTKLLHAQIARLNKHNARLEQQLGARSITNGLFKVGRLFSTHMLRKGPHA